MKNQGPVTVELDFPLKAIFVHAPRAAEASHLAAALSGMSVTEWHACLVKALYLPQRSRAQDL